MRDFIPIDEFVSDEWYPGFPQTNAHAPWVAEGLARRSSRATSNASAARLPLPPRHGPARLHLPRGRHLLGHAASAGLLPPPSRGLVAHGRTAHLQRTGRRRLSWRLQSRAGASPATLPSSPTSRRSGPIASSSWRASWPTSRPTTTPSTRRRRSAPTSPTPRRSSSGRGRSTSMMYPLLAAYVGFYGLCQQLGLDPGEISKFLQDTTPRSWRSTGSCRSSPAPPVGPNCRPNSSDRPRRSNCSPPSRRARTRRARAGCTRSQPAAWRQPHPRIADVVLPSSREDAVAARHDQDVPPTAMTTTSGLPGPRRRRALEAIENMHSKLSAAQRAQFDEGLAGCEAANFAWWNEEHNYYIDLRAHLPLRRAHWRWPPSAEPAR